jgi:hypothetical protein
MKTASYSVDSCAETLTSWFAQRSGPLSAVWNMCSSTPHVLDTLLFYLEAYDKAQIAGGGGSGKCHAIYEESLHLQKVPHNCIIGHFFGSTNFNYMRQCATLLTDPGEISGMSLEIALSRIDFAAVPRHPARLLP